VAFDVTVGDVGSEPGGGGDCLVAVAAEQGQDCGRAVRVPREEAAHPGRRRGEDRGGQGRGQPALLGR
jgi:hypothetical protein